MNVNASRDFFTLGLFSRRAVVILGSKSQREVSGGTTFAPLMFEERMLCVKTAIAESATLSSSGGWDVRLVQILWRGSHRSSARKRNCEDERSANCDGGSVNISVDLPGSRLRLRGLTNKLIGGRRRCRSGPFSPGFRTSFF